jgi:predicted TIM-barrel fold metal-dependent hydrolase
MCDAHQHLLSRNKISVEAIPKIDPPQVQALLQQDLTAQITHNVRAGLLAQVDEQKVRYTWRGMFYLWFRLLWDSVRL